MERTSPFIQWLKAVGLKETFPRLSPVDFHKPGAKTGQTRVVEDDFYFGPNEDLIEAAIKSSRQPRVANLFPDGHGISTIARYVYERCAFVAAERGIVAVRVSLEDLLQIGQGIGSGTSERYAKILELARAAGPEGIEEASERAFAGVESGAIQEHIETRIKNEIVRSLLTEAWELATSENYYSSLIGAPQATTAALEERRRYLINFIEPDGALRSTESIHEVVDDAPLLTRSWLETMEELHDRAGIRLSLQLDLSPSPLGRTSDANQEYYTQAYETALGESRAALKNIEEKTGAYLSRSFFIGKEGLEILESDVPKGLETRSFAPYTELDAFTILAIHYPRSVAGKLDRPDELAAVFDSSLLQHSENKSLSRMAEDLSSRLKQIAPEDLRFQLTAKLQGVFGQYRGLEELAETIEQQQRWQDAHAVWRSEVDEWRTQVDDRLAAVEQGEHGPGQ